MNNDSRSANQSRASNYSAANRNTSRPNSRAPVVTPAEKNMEVIVGKGRSSSRPNSAALNKTNSNNSINQKNAPKSGVSVKDKDSSNEYKCENCEKCYNNIKDFDIHKLYCNKK